MLDKSIPYKNIIMKLTKEDIKTIGEPELPQGFSFRFFENGDEVHWARIETSVLEFDFEEEAKEYFIRDYLPYLNEIKKRCVFIVNEVGLPVATATAWFAKSELGYQASLHWVGVCPAYQGRGLGKAVVQKAITVFKTTDPNEDIILHTQTWSNVAIRVYHKIGFNMMKHERVAMMSNSIEGTEISKNDFSEAIEVLKDVIDEKLLQNLISTAK